MEEDVLSDGCLDRTEMEGHIGGVYVWKTHVGRMCVVILVERERDRDVCNSVDSNLPCSADIMGPAMKTVSTCLDYIIIDIVEGRDLRCRVRPIFIKLCFPVKLEVMVQTGCTL